MTDAEPSPERATLHPPRWARIAEPLAAAAFALWLSRPFWWPGTYVAGFDTLTYTGPNFVVTMDAWRNGSLPLWNDYLFGGVVHLANPQTAALSPLKVIGLFFDTNRAMGVTVAVQMVIMAVGAVMLLRRLGARPPFGLVGAIVMVGNGAVVMRSIQFEQIAVVAWIPWLLLGITAVVATDRRSWRAIAGLSAATAMILVAGHPQMQYLAVVMAALWTLGVLMAARGWSPLRARIGDLAGAVALGGLAATLHLVALVAGVSDSAGPGERSLESLTSTLLSSRFQDLPRAVLGSIRSQDQVQFAGSYEGLAAVGVTGSIIGLAGIVVLWRYRRLRSIAIALAAMALTGAVWALGPRTPVFTLAYRLLPGFDLTRASSRWLTMTALAASIAIALGLQALRFGPGSILNRPTPTPPAHSGPLRSTQPDPEVATSAPVEVRAIQITVTTVIVVALTIVTIGAFGRFRLPDTATLLSWLAISAVCIAALISLTRSRWSWMIAALAIAAVLEIGAFSRNSVVDNSITSTPVEALAPGPAAAVAGQAGLSVAFTFDIYEDPGYLRANHRPNTNVFDGSRSLDGYDGGVQITERYFDLLERLDSATPREMPLRNQIPLPLETEFAAELGLRWALVDNTHEAAEILQGWTKTAFVDDAVTVWENPDWIADAMITQPGTDAIALGVDQPGPGRIQVVVPSGTEVGRSGNLTVMRQFAPGWTAAVNGASIPVTTIDGFWLGVDLEAPEVTNALTTRGFDDQIRIDFQYRPRWVAPGAALSILGLLGIVITAIIGIVDGRRVRRSTPTNRTRPS